ncbi:MFS transporter [Nakamurella sp.]|uniref:MFS transporter n=1 Tax=Nakamurella sp. TaxID=1869182 RepID=UPI0037852DDE
MTTLAARPTYRSALRSRDFRLLLAGHGIGTIAQLALTLALGIEVLERTGSGWWLSVTVALGFVPYVLASGYAGLLADRHSRSAVLTLTFLTRAGCAALLAIGLPLHWPVPVQVAIAAITAVLATPSYPALAAATVQCMPDAQLPPANALVTGVENAGWMAGPGVLGLILLTGGGPAVAVGVAAALFLAAAALSGRVRLPRPDRTSTDDDGLWPELRAGLLLVGRVAAVRRPMTVAVIDNFLYGYLVVAVVLIGQDAFGDEGVGLLNSAAALGGLLSLAPVALLSARVRPGGLLLAAMSTFGAAVLLVGLSGSAWLSAALVFVAGGASLLAEVTAVTLLQRATPEALTARVFGVYDQLNVGALAAGSLLAGPLAAALGAGGAMVAVAVLSLVAGVIATGRLLEPRRRGRHAAG